MLISPNSSPKTKRPFLLRPENRYLWYTLILPGYLLVFFVEEQLLSPDMVVWHTALPMDYRIPFCKYFVWAYVSWYFLLVITGLYLMAKDHEGYKRYMAYIGITFFTGVIFCALVPNQQDLRVLCDLSGNDICTKILLLIQRLDNDMNVCPSLHVVGGFGALFAIFTSPAVRRRWPKIAISLMVVLISLATLLIKQHAIIDVLVSIPYSVAFYFVVYRVIFRTKKSPTVSSATQQDI